jgi:hypothetical protein
VCVCVCVCVKSSGQRKCFTTFVMLDTLFRTQESAGGIITSNDILKSKWSRHLCVCVCELIYVCDVIWEGARCFKV